MDEEEKRQLQEAMIAAHMEREASWVNAITTEIELYSTFFLHQYRLYKVVSHIPPVLLYLGFAPGLPVYDVTRKPAAFVALARADHVHLKTVEMAAHYGAVYLNVATPLSEGAMIVNSADAIPFLAGVDEKEQQQQQKIIEQYRATITPPTAQETGQGYRVSVYMVHMSGERLLNLHILDVKPDGEVTNHSVTTLEKGLPIPYVV